MREEISRLTNNRTAIAIMVTVLAMLPIAAHWSYKVFVQPRPYWILYYDPELVYYYNGYQLLNGDMPFVTAHPGTPTQMLTAAIIYLTGATNPIDVDRFRMGAYVVAGVLYVGAAFLLARVTLTKLPIPLQIAALWSYFITPMALHFNSIWSAEIIYFPAGVVAIVILWIFFRRELSYRRALLVGLPIGLCCAVKVTFLSWALALAAAIFFTPGRAGINRLKLAGISLAGVGLGFLAGTIVITPRYPAMILGFLRRADRQGWVGSQSAPRSNMAEVLVPWQRLWFGEGKEWYLEVWYLWFGAALILLLFDMIRKYRRGEAIAAGFSSLTVFALVGFGLNYLLAFRNPALRFLLPSGLAGLLIVILAMHTLALFRSKWIQVVVVVIAGVLVVTQIRHDVAYHDNLITAGEQTRQGIASLLNRELDPQKSTVVVYGFPAPQPSLALQLHARQPEQIKAIQAKFPNEGYYKPWSQKIYLPEPNSTWDYLVIRQTDLNDFPEPVGLTVGKVAEYVIVKRAQ